MNVSEEQIAGWSKPPSESEDQRCLEAISQVTDAVRAEFGTAIKIIRQGSHTNRTNIRVDSDVDVAVVHTGFFFPDISFMSAADKALHQENRVPGTYPFASFKSDIEKVLRTKFGAANVSRKNKCLRVAGNVSRVSIDVVPAFEHRRFEAYQSVSALGIEFVCDDGHSISSFPEQHYQNGVAKNEATGRRFKSAVRILKRARNQLLDEKKITADSMPSFLLECLVWNVHKDQFGKQTWREEMDSITTKIWNDMRNPERAKDYAEVCDLKYLLRGNKTPKQAEDFMLQAWRLLTK